MKFTQEQFDRLREHLAQYETHQRVHGDRKVTKVTVLGPCLHVEFGSETQCTWIPPTAPEWRGAMEILGLVL